MLELKGHQVEIALDGPAGLRAARGGRPDAIICDIGLPGGMSGYEVAERLRADPPGPLPLLIALTGYGQERDRQRALAAGFDHHLTKPVGAKVLQKLLAAAREPDET